MESNKTIAAVRTMCAALGPGLLAVLVTWLGGFGVDLEITTELELAVTVLLFGAVTGLWNFVVNVISERHPKFGILLGINRPPTYGERSPDESPSELA